MAASDDFSRSVTKIDRMQHLAAMPLDDAEASWEEYAAVRKIIIIYLQVVGLWDYVVDFAAATRTLPSDFYLGGCQILAYQVGQKEYKDRTTRMYVLGVLR